MKLNYKPKRFPGLNQTADQCSNSSEFTLEPTDNNFRMNDKLKGAIKISADRFTSDQMSSTNQKKKKKQCGN